jgi:ATP-dependent Clp protease ATP-binding subunit ClpC
MATYRFPVLVWEDFAGRLTARPLEAGAEVAGTGRTADEALAQVKEYYSWLYQQRNGLDAPDFLNAQLALFKVPIRPEYRQGNRIHPCDETLTLRVYGVHGRQQAGLLVCSLPMLDLNFTYYEANALKELVTRYVQLKLQGLTPRDLSRYLLPQSVALDEVVIRLAHKEARFRPSQDWPTLSRIAEPLGQRALRKQFSRAWERDEEVRTLVRKLHLEKANVLLVGEPGVGKTTTLVEAVQIIERQPTDPEPQPEGVPARPRFWLTSAAQLIAGMRYLGQWEERCEAAIAELSDGKWVLCVENLLELVRTGGSGPGDSLAAFFLPYLRRGELRLVGEATPAELDACRRLLPGLVDLFQIVHLPAFSRAKALAILDRLATSLKQHLHLEMASGVPDLVYHLFHRFAPYQAFPGKAVAFARELFERASRERATDVTKERVIAQFVRQTGLPELFLRDEVPLRREEVVEAFRAQVIGQEAACQAAANVVTTFKAGLQDPGRPVGVLLFCGPTGVGKTELARALARYFFGHGEQTERLIRLDMSEYTGPGAPERLLGPPAGEPSHLIKQIRQQPFAVLLLDEIEKADPEIFDILLSVFDEGRLTDRYGRVTIFRSAVIVMTSNLGAEKQETLGLRRQPAIHYDAEALAFFRPEFYNRIDAVVTFQPLQQETVLAITSKELAEIARREGLVKAGLRLTWTDRLVAQLAREGFDVRYGARPLQRTLETRVVTALARYLVNRPGLKEGRIEMDWGTRGEVEFRFDARD